MNREKNQGPHVTPRTPMGVGPSQMTVVNIGKVGPAPTACSTTRSKARSTARSRVRRLALARARYNHNARDRSCARAGLRKVRFIYRGLEETCKKTSLRKRWDVIGMLGSPKRRPGCNRNVRIATAPTRMRQRNYM